MRVMVSPITAGALEMVPKSLEMSLEELEIRRIETMENSL